MSEHIHCTTLEVWRAHFPFRLAFSHNLASRRGAETLIVALGDDSGRVGYGQVLPRGYLTGETLESAAEDIRERWWPEIARLALPAGAGRDGVAEALRPVFEKADAGRLNASYAGIDVAAFSLAANVWPRTGAARDFPLVGVISAAGPKKAAWLARVMRWLGYRRFKVKVGRDADADAARLAAVRRAVGADSWLAVDANAAWEWDEAVERMRGLAAWGVALAEEPLCRAAAETADFRRLEKAAGMAVMADESLCTLADARGLLERGGPSWWNVRLAKNGGVGGAAAFASLARANGIRLYGGILVGETGALAAAGREVFPETGAECGEYGFSRVFLRGDPFRGSPAGYRGRYAGEGDWSALRLDGKILAENGERLYRLER